MNNFHPGWMPIVILMPFAVATAQPAAFADTRLVAYAVAPDSVEHELIEVLGGLNRPGGVAVQPETGIVFVAESGQGRIIRVVDGLAEPVITDFPLTTAADSGAVIGGPVGIQFLNRNLLAVSRLADTAGAALLSVYEVSSGAASVKSDVVKSAVTWAEGDGNATRTRLLALTVTTHAAFAASWEGADDGMIARATRTGDGLSDLQTFFGGPAGEPMSRPGGLALSPHGYLVVGQMGQLTDQADSLLEFYDTASGERLLRLETGLRDIVAIAYSPRKQLYVLDLSSAQAGSGGLFRVVADRSSPTGMQAQRIVALEYPTAMAFDSHGALYITTRGDPDDPSTTRGRLLKIQASANL